jgi:creatinine amidohydrolase
LPLGPLEEHGPHLPFGVDAFNAEFIAQEVALMIKEIDPELTIVRIPVLHVGAHVYRFGGSLWVRQRVLRDLVVDYGRALACHGFEKIIVISAHGGPRHFVALDEAAAIVSRRGKVSMISLTSRLIFDFLMGRYMEAINAQMQTPFTDEDKRILTMDYHAGWWETSMMLWLKPHLVDAIYKTLPPALVPRHHLRPDSPLKAGPGLGYLGAPAKASVEFAQASIAAMRSEIMRMLRGFLGGTLDWRSVRSPLYYVPIFRTNYRRWLFALAAIPAVMVGIWIASFWK